jgi:hypothetical protein
MPTPSNRPPPEEDDGAFVLRFGTGVGAAAIAAAVAAVPAAMRAAPGSQASTFAVWSACAAAWMLPMLVAVIVLRRARAGVRALGGSDAAARAVGAMLWLFGLFVFEALFGSVLRATTHHHALAGTTYAIVSAGVAVVLAILCARVSTIIAAQSAGVRRFLIVATSGLLGLAILVASLRLARAFGGADAGGSSPAALLVDVLAFAITAALASRAAFTRLRALALAGPPLAVAILAVGLWAVRGPAVADAIGARAPAIAPISSVLAGH